jgi:Flp pilus assembly protein TadD
MKTIVSTAILMTGFLGTSLPAAAQSIASNAANGAQYQLSAVIDQAQGEAVLSGNYEKAIAKLSGRGQRFEASTNLCVAYALSGDLQAADSACTTAIAISKRNVRHAGPASVRDQLRDFAVALSNQGVVMALRGDMHGAQRYFTEAVELQAGVPQASNNLSRLNAAGYSHSANAVIEA